MDGHFSPTWLQTPPNHNLSPQVQWPYREVSHTSQIIPPSTPLDRELDTGTFLGTLSSYKEDLGCRVNFFHAMTLQTPTNTSSSCVKSPFTCGHSYIPAWTLTHITTPQFAAGKICFCSPQFQPHSSSETYGGPLK